MRLVFNKVNRLEIQSVMLVFFIQLSHSLWFNSAPSPPSLCE
jgi:hypothetical protein